MTTPISTNAHPIRPELLKSIPAKPGVYLMRDKDSCVLYVGKATNLKKRLASYKRSHEERQPKITVMLSRVCQIETILTGTEKEALILESSLIKKYRPRYNVTLRDDKNYPMIKVTINEEWPRVMMTRKKRKDGSRYFGPYSSSSAMWETLNYLNELFPLRRCKGKDIRIRQRPCLNYQIGRCLAPCAGKTDRNEYLDNVTNIMMVLDGKNNLVVRQLQAKMQHASESLDFETAAVCRDRINALTKTLEKQVMAGNHLRDQDVFGFARRESEVAVSVVMVRKGTVSGHRSYFIDESFGEDPEVLAEIIRRYYDADRIIPHEIILPFEVPDRVLLHRWLTEKKGQNVTLLTPQRGDKLKLLQVAVVNAEKTFEEKADKRRAWDKIADNLQRKLHLHKRPTLIECVDISNISGEMAVGSLVSFVFGEPDKSKYRHYKIKSVAGPDDYAMMAEVLQRRFAHHDMSNKLPDLLLVDGGKGQLNIAKTILADLGLNDLVDIVGIAKEKQQEGEKLYLPGRKNPIIPSRHSPMLLLLMRIRDESHRYGITFHRKLRTKYTVKSALDRISGIGPNKRRELLKYFGSVRNIKESSIEELMQAPGIGPDLARKIQHFFQDL